MLVGVFKSLKNCNIFINYKILLKFSFTSMYIITKKYSNSKSFTSMNPKLGTFECQIELSAILSVSEARNSFHSVASRFEAFEFQVRMAKNGQETPSYSFQEICFFTISLIQN